MGVCLFSWLNKKARIEEEERDGMEKSPLCASVKVSLKKQCVLTCVYPCIRNTKKN